MRARYLLSLFFWICQALWIHSYISYPRFSSIKVERLQLSHLNSKRKGNFDTKKKIENTQKAQQPEEISDKPFSQDSVIPRFDSNRGTFMDVDPEDDAQKQRELRQQLLDENQKLQRIFEEKRKKVSIYGDVNMDEESLAMEEAQEQYERIRNRADEQIQLQTQLSRIELQRIVEDGKEYWIHPLFQELGITLPNPRGKTPEEFDLVGNLQQIQSSFLGLRPTPQFNDIEGTSNSSEQDLFFDPPFRANSTARKFTKFYPYGYYAHLPMLTLQSPFDIFGNVYSMPEQYYKLLPTLDAFRLTQEFWRQHDAREEDLAALWYSEDHRKEKELRQLSPWIRAAIFGIDNDNGTNQALEDKIISFVEALIYGAIFVLFLNIVLGISNGLVNFFLRRDFEFFLQNDWWAMSLAEVWSHLPKFEGVELNAISKALYSGTSSPPVSP